MQSIEYKGHKIIATPYQLAKSKRWALEFQIYSLIGNNVVAKMFSAVNPYKTEKEATLHCLNLAKKIIDS